MERRAFYGQRSCDNCGRIYDASRKHSHTCGETCRKARQRQRKLNERIRTAETNSLPMLPRGVPAGSLAAQVFSGMIVNATDIPPETFKRGAIDENGGYEPPAPRKKPFTRKQKPDAKKLPPKRHKKPSKASKATGTARKPSPKVKTRRNAKIKP